MSAVDPTCERTDLPQAMCAHCRGLTRLTREEYVRRYKARLAGGDDSGLIHELSAETAVSP